MFPLCVSTIEGSSPKWSIGRINIVTENLFKASRKNVAFPGGDESKTIEKKRGERKRKNACGQTSSFLPLMMTAGLWFSVVSKCVEK